MIAVVHTKYGPPDELQLKQTADPVPSENEILVRIHATSVTTSDCNMRDLTFVPGVFGSLMKLQFGVRKPRNERLGFDFSGTVAMVGKDVSRFVQGDEVFGTFEPLTGTQAQYICIREDAVVAQKPANVSHEEAAVFPVAAITALHFIKNLGNVQAAQRVLINGASGAIGTFAVQIARHLGAHVTGVCSTTNLELVRSLGADEVVDYTKEDFTRSGAGDSDGKYDVVLDAVGKSSFSQCRGTLNPHGIYLTTLPSVKAFAQMAWTSIFAGKKVKVEGAPATAESLLYLKSLMEAGDLRPVIDRRYRLEEISDAYAYVESGHKKGNVVVLVP